LSLFKYVLSILEFQKKTPEKCPHLVIMKTWIWVI